MSCQCPSCPCPCHGNNPGDIKNTILGEDMLIHELASEVISTNNLIERIRISAENYEKIINNNVGYREAYTIAINTIKENNEFLKSPNIEYLYGIATDTATKDYLYYDVEVMISALKDFSKLYDCALKLKKQ